MRDVLDRAWVRPRPTRRQRRLDVVVGVVAMAAAVANVELYRSAFGADLGWHGVEAYGWFGLAGLLLAGRRTIPLTVAVVEAAVFIVIGERLGVLGATFTIQIVLFASLYAAWAWSRRPRALLAVSVLVVVAMFTWLLVSLLQPGALPETDQGGLLAPAASALGYSVAINVVYFLGAIAWGHTAWLGAPRRQAAEQRVALELALAESRRAHAVADERVRIARDLHDVVAHHVSSIGVQATGAERLLDVDPGAAHRALLTIADSSRQAVEQMHQLVQLLRDPSTAGGPGTGRSPAPGLGDLAGLADADGAPVVEHTVVGAPFDVPPTTSTSLFRIAQEAVTNVHRHSAARHASVVLRYLDDPHAVELEVLDDGRGARTGPSDGGGFGLAGIRERTALHAGEADIGPRPGGGFRVRVRIPVAQP